MEFIIKGVIKMDDYQEKLAINFLSGVNETILKMTGFSLTENIHKDNDCSNDIAGMVFMTGLKNTVFLLSTQKEVASVFVSYMTGIEESNLKNTDIYDGISEILNMAAGLAKSKLEDNEKILKLSSPISIIGTNIAFQTKNFVRKYEYNLYSDDMKIKVGVYYI
jgi:CheY-specific phosphatase CheX